MKTLILKLLTLSTLVATGLWASDMPNPVKSKRAASHRPVIPEAVRLYMQHKAIDPQWDWKQPINFWGRVLDESNNPVTGASVHFMWNDLSATGTSEADTESDRNGFFSLTGKKGKRLYVTVAKNGYYTSSDSRGRAFEYANPFDGRFTPDPNNPVIFHLRKEGVGAELVVGSEFLGSRIDGTLSYVDLTTGKNSLAPPGDLTVRFTRDLQNTGKKWFLIVCNG
ncbi:MAG: carboxypeptidase regulatory-like domain-containing protein [Verrucomicrobiota bacterium]|nr:carboxypeptidase regulatory-like domain-containing protein [Verrucomicrobiota bacterium]